MRSAVAAIVCAVASSVARPLTTSTSRICGTGLKKCMPTTRPGTFSPAASAVIDSDDVLEARIVAGVTIFSSSRRSVRFSPRSSTIASTTRSALTQSPSAWTATMRAPLAAASAASSLPFAASACSDCAIARTRLLRAPHPGVEEPHRMSGLRRDLRDARTHRPGADDGDRCLARQGGRRGHQ